MDIYLYIDEMAKLIQQEHEKEELSEEQEQVMQDYKLMQSLKGKQLFIKVKTNQPYLMLSKDDVLVDHSRFKEVKDKYRLKNDYL